MEENPCSAIMVRAPVAKGHIDTGHLSGTLTFMQGTPAAKANTTLAERTLHVRKGFHIYSSGYLAPLQNDCISLICSDRN